MIHSHYLLKIFPFLIIYFTSSAFAHNAKAQLDELLEQRACICDSFTRDLFDRELEWRFELPLAVMVTDTSGMTELTRSKGIAEVLSRIKLMHTVSRPLVTEAGGFLVKTVADDMYIVHTSVCLLYELARELIMVNREVDVTLSVGISYGHVFFLGNEIWGNAVNIASKLGEDTAQGSEILISRSAFHELYKEAGSGTKCPVLGEFADCAAPFNCAYIESKDLEHLRMRVPEARSPVTPLTSSSRAESSNH